MTHIAKSAILSQDGLYRYSLTRTMREGGLIALWLGINPSTADHLVDDQSIRKLYGFGRKLNVGTWLVGNMFALRATDPRKLATVEDPIGRHNDLYLLEMMNRADLVIAGWGSIGKVPPQFHDRYKGIVSLARGAQKPLKCWGLCRDGHPRHPLMLSYATPLENWKDPTP